MGSISLPHLRTGWHVDQAILGGRSLSCPKSPNALDPPTDKTTEEDRVVVIRFGRDHDSDCMRQDEVLYRIAERVKNFAAIYLCDIDQVPDFNQMYG